MVTKEWSLASFEDPTTGPAAQAVATLQSDPSLNWVSCFDSCLFRVTNSLDRAGLSDKVSGAGFDCNPENIAIIREGGSQKVCFANASISNPWRQTGWITMNQQLKALQKTGVISEMETRDAKDNDNTQIADIDYFIAEGNCDAFVISPNSTAALTPAVERACETGKPVVVFDRGVETDCATTFIHPIGGFAWGID
ncbi:substrate-binding domain-containing protein, partial [Thermocatellispora tengchongensis]|uniref:substrate-binding domain-containing protein n=1 Tax=Thermocatellispora tengchongensis TaxID=1073253 RepID=UPI0031EE6F04